MNREMLLKVIHLLNRETGLDWDGSISTERAGGRPRKQATYQEVAPRIRESVKLTYDYDSSNVQPCLRKRTPRNLRRMPSSETWIVSAERN